MGKERCDGGEGGRRTDNNDGNEARGNYEKTEWRRGGGGDRGVTRSRRVVFLPLGRNGVMRGGRWRGGREL